MRTYLIFAGVDQLKGQGGGHDFLYATKDENHALKVAKELIGKKLDQHTHSADPLDFIQYGLDNDDIKELGTIVWAHVVSSNGICAEYGEYYEKSKYPPDEDEEDGNDTISQSLCVRDK